MPASWKQEYCPSQVVEKLEATRKIGVDNKVKFEGWGHLEFVALLYSMLNFPDDIPEIDARRIVSKAIFTSGAKGIITVQSLLTEINKLEREYQSSPIERYALASSISISLFSKIPNINIGNTIIIFERSLPKRFRQESESLIKHAEQSLFASLPTDYLKVRVHVSAKSIHHAADQALEILDFTRGVWNWVFNRRHSFRMSWGGKPSPVNNIILGPIHTLHRPNGGLAAKDNWWYEPSYFGAIQPFSPKQDEINSMSKSFEHIKNVFKTHKYSQVIQSSIVRYTRALDERDWTTAFIKLWSILELLTDTTRSNYEITIKRTAFLYQERDYHLQVLQHLREYRNSSIHFNKGNSEIETYLYQIKNYVEHLIGFHVNNRYGFESIQEAAGFLSLPPDDQALKSQIEKLTFARKLRGYG
jgi:hypothetical protein